MSTTTVRCPRCARDLDGHLCAAAQPTPGAATVCVHCGQISVYTTEVCGRLALRTPSTAELEELLGDPRIVMATLIVARVRAEGLA